MAGETAKVISKLRLIWESAQGYFISGVVGESEKENISLIMLRKSNPDDFQKIFSDRAHLLRITQSFIARHGFPPSRFPPIPAESHTRFDILKRVVVGAFALEHNVDMDFNNGGFEHKRIEYTLDPLDKPVDQVKPPSDGLLLTIPSRVEPLLARGIRTVAPRALCRTWNQRLIETFLHNSPLSAYEIQFAHETKAAAPAPLTAAEQAYRDEYQKVLELGFLGDRAFWPRSENDDFHTDWREYPGFDHKLDGKFKYRFDKTALRSPKEKPAGYVFGVWKLKDKQSQVKTPEIKINPEALEIVRKIMKRKNEEAAQKIMDKIRDEDKG